MNTSDDLTRLRGEYNAAVANGLVLKARQIARRIDALEEWQEKRTFKEWNESGEFPFKVLDPDGFPRFSIDRMQNERYTRDEFYERAMSSTILPVGNFR